MKWSNIYEMTITVADVQWSVLTYVKWSNIYEMTITVADVQWSVLTYVKWSNVYEMTITVADVQWSVLTYVKWSNIYEMTITVADVQWSVFTYASQTISFLALLITVYCNATETIKIIVTSVKFGYFLWPWSMPFNLLYIRPYCTKIEWIPL